MIIENTTDPVNRVRELIRPHLNYDGETEVYRHITSLGRISCTHGMGIDAVIRLATFGRFVGGEPALEGEFYTTPNMHFRNWSDTDVGSYIGAVATERAIDAIKLGVLYAGTHEPTAEEADILSRVNNGVVVAFNAAAIHPNSQIYESTLNDLEHAIELILPEAPSIDMVEGIYPVDAEAQTELNDALSAIH